MPPKIKVTEDSILDAAIAMTREKGIDCVNARELAKALSCSIQPIFRSFQSMENLKKQLAQRAETIFNDAMTQEAERNGIPFLGRSLAHLEFANREKKLYQFLFLSDAVEGKSTFERMRDEENQETISVITGMTGLNAEHAQQLFVDIWLITHGIASLVATDHAAFSEEEMVKTLTVLVDSFLGIQHELSKKKKTEIG